jgi:hypothetical protein
MNCPISPLFYPIKTNAECLMRRVILYLHAHQRWEPHIVNLMSSRSTTRWRVLIMKFLYFSLWLYSPLNLGRIFSSLILYTVGRSLLTGDQPVARPLPTHRTSLNKRTQISMPWMEFEPTTPEFVREKTVHASDCEAIVMARKLLSM